MLTQEIKVNGQSTINIILKEDSQQLEEIIVIGYGAAKAKDLTAPITVVKGETLTRNRLWCSKSQRFNCSYYRCKGRNTYFSTIYHTDGSSSGKSTRRQHCK